MTRRKGGKARIAEGCPAKKSSRNAEIEAYRFVMAIMVAMLHFSEDYAGYHGPFPGGFLGVDFFFILSGFCLMQNFESRKHGGTPFESTAEYFAGRVRKLYPPYLVATLLMLLTTWVINGGGLARLLRQIWDIRWQLVGLHYTGMPAGFNMRSVWYISPLLLLSWAVFFLLALNREAFLGIAPFAGITLLAYIANEFGTLSMQGSMIFMFKGGVVRGFAEMSLGVVLAHVVRARGSGMPRGRAARCVPLLARAFCYGLIFGVMRLGGFDITDFTLIPAFLLLIFIAARYPLGAYVEGARHPALRHLGGVLGRLMQYMGAISYWAYLLHLIVSKVLVTFFANRPFRIMLPAFLLLATAASAIAKGVYDRVRAAIGRGRA